MLDESSSNEADERMRSSALEEPDLYELFMRVPSSWRFSSSWVWVSEICCSVSAMLKVVCSSSEVAEESWSCREESVEPSESSFAEAAERSSSGLAMATVGATVSAQGVARARTNPAVMMHLAWVIA
ncbi:hypothetical protein DWW58_03360 [Olsenella sp. AF16-14LB]|nr:hypothetical protein DWX86_00440 [Olsenella sp. AF21-51]RGU51644.1 hypothetical protein DWW58_03360 [Olsenella sp. AF16-14LB]RGU82873.1 hypothetical protein DWW44_03355 [Olsenella sp. AF15-43LB]RHD75433.1 hypothetical protein DW781_04035 [Olsenella sp. AM30-3LB]RHK05014.1 hypothetical protein DW087_00400 [Olsenella sp. AM04-33]